MANAVDVRVGAMIRALRLASGRSERDTAAALGLAVVEYARREAGSVRFRAVDLFRLAHFFEVEIAAFFADASARDVRQPSVG